MLKTEMILTQESIVDFQQSLNVRGLGPLTVKAYSTDLQVFFQEMKLEKVLLSQLEQKASEWLNCTRRPTPGCTLKVVAAKTTNRRMTSLRSFGKWAGRVILEDYSGPTPPRVTPSAFPEGMDGIRRMLAETDDEQQRVLLGLCGLCGLRVGEALAVTPDDFDLDRRVISVRGKGESERKVPFSEEALGIFIIRLATVPGDSPLVGLNDRWARKLVTSIGERVLNRGVASHDLRKTLGTAVNDKYGLRTAQEILGHASVITTQAYTLVTFETMRAAIEGV